MGYRKCLLEAGEFLRSEGGPRDPLASDGALRVSREDWQAIYPEAAAVDEM
jgi:hypothetical protein